MSSELIAREIAALGFPYSADYRDGSVALHSKSWLIEHGKKVKKAVSILPFRDSAWDCDKVSMRSLDIANEDWARRATGPYGHSRYVAWIGIAIGCEEDYWRKFGATGAVQLNLSTHYTVLCRCDDDVWYLQEPLLGVAVPFLEFRDEKSELGSIVTRLKKVF